MANAYFLIVIFIFITSGAISQDSGDILSSDKIKLIRGPYLQSGTQSSMIIKWRTDRPTNSKVVFGTDPEVLDQVKYNDLETTEHEVFIDNLKGYTKYYYAIGNDTELWIKEDLSYYFMTSPVENHDQVVRIWAIGDFGSGDEDPENVKKGYLSYKRSNHTDVWLMLGDMAYYYGKDEEFQKGVFSGVYKYMLRNAVIWPTPGNHDMRSADSETQTGPYYDVFSIPINGEAGGEPSGTEAYYSFNYGDIHFISMDSEDTQLEKNGKMAEWLKRDLKNDNHKWKIAYFHHPPYTKGTHDSDNDFDSGGRMKEMRENFLPILESGGVDLVMSGHSHIYERSFFLNGHYDISKKFNSKRMIVENDNDKKINKTTFFKTKNGPGTIYIVCGISGSRPSAGTCDHPAIAVCQYWHRGSMAIDIRDNLLLAVFVDQYGKVRDSFSITKEF